MVEGSTLLDFTHMLSAALLPPCPCEEPRAAPTEGRHTSSLVLTTFKSLWHLSINYLLESTERQDSGLQSHFLSLPMPFPVNTKCVLSDLRLSPRRPMQGHMRNLLSWEVVTPETRRSANQENKHIGPAMSPWEGQTEQANGGFQGCELTQHPLQGAFL